jgi:outer membrane protein assembly factor BamA
MRTRRWHGNFPCGASSCILDPVSGRRVSSAVVGLRTRVSSASNLPCLAALAVAVGVVAGACRPWVRFGDIEAPAAGSEPGPTAPATGSESGASGARGPDERRPVLVDVRVEAEDGARMAEARPETLADGVAAEVALLPVPAVAASEVASELESQPQSASVPASEALADASRLGVDARRLTSIYQARGYFRARVTAWGLRELPGARAVASLRVVEGTPTRLGAVSFTGQTPPEDDPEAAALLARLWRRLPTLTPVREGAIWTEADWLAALATLRRTFRAAGFVEAEVTGETQVTEGTWRATATFRIDHGPLARFSGVWRVTGARMADEARIWRRVALPEGAILDARTLEAAEQRLFDLGPFLYVRLRPGRRLAVPALLKPALDGLPLGGMSPGPAAPVPDSVGPGGPAPAASAPDERILPLPTAAVARGGHDLVIDLQESAPWDLELGFGARTDSTQLSLELPVGFNHRDVFGDLVAVHAEGRPALVFPDVFEEAASGLRVGGLARLTLSVPTFVAETLRFDTSLNYRRDVTQGASIEELSGALGWSLRLGRHVTARTGWNLAYSNYVDATVFARVTEERTLDALSLRLRRSDRLAWLGGSVVYDSRDAIFEARRGVLASLGVDLAAPWLASRAPFERLVVEGRTYLTPTGAPWLTVALRLRAGGLGFRGDVGTSEVARLKAGGQSSMRGFAANRLGEYLCVRNVEGDGDPINGACGEGLLDRVYVGGNYLLEGNAEVRLRLGDVGLVAFADVGQLWNRLDEVNPEGLRVAVGPGLRYLTPIGPLRADIGFLLGATITRQFHIGLGQAF